MAQVDRIAEVSTASLWGFVVQDDGELSDDPVRIRTERIARDVGNFEKILAECADDGLEAHLFDARGNEVGRVCCDGDVRWFPRPHADRCPPEFAPGQIVRVERVDEFGFLGRDHHPKKSDVGKLARVEVVEYESDHRPLDEEEEDVAILTCSVLDVDGCNEVGRVLEFVSSEVLIESDPR